MGVVRKVSNWYFRRRMLPYWAILMADTAIVLVSVVFTYWISSNTEITYEHRVVLLRSALVYSVLSWVGAKCFRTYSGVLRFSSFMDLLKVAAANLVNLILTSTVSGLSLQYGSGAVGALNPLLLLMAFILATLLMWLLRVAVKLLYDVTRDDTSALRALVFGSMSEAVGIGKYIRAQTPPQFDLRGIVSQDERLVGIRVLDVKVYSIEEDFEALVKKERIKAFIVGSQRANAFRHNQALQDLLISMGVKIFMSFGAQELDVNKEGTDEPAKGAVQLKEVSVEDLLPRQEIQVNMKSVARQLSGRRVLVTGSAGSIGQEIVRQVAGIGPEKMLLIDQAETPQHDLKLMMDTDFPDVPCEIVVTSVTHRKRMEKLFHDFRPEYVFHAAAYKHVPMMEDNPSEAILNNVYGTKVLADLSVRYGVKKFVMVSTDKAVNPSNVMGCSKRICEIYVQSLDRKLKMEDALSGFRNYGQRSYTQFITTRFGNVLGSNGSVIPLFREQIKKGGPVTVTDERIVRYFMLIPEACRLVLEAGTHGSGGEIFVFDMGDPVRIADLAKRMIALSGAKGVEIKYTGLREGEKLYEEVLSKMEGTKPTFHEKIRIAQVREYDYDEVSKAIDQLLSVAKEFNDMETVRKMKELVPEFKSMNSAYESLDGEAATS